MSVALKVNLDFDYITCCVCGVFIVMETEILRHRRDDHKTFYCINGHAQSFRGKSEAEKLKDKLEREAKRHEWTKKSLEQERKSHSSTKGQLTKIKNRVKNGVCPFCNRSFQNLQRHMKSKHNEELEKNCHEL